MATYWRRKTAEHGDDLDHEKAPSSRKGIDADHRVTYRRFVALLEAPPAVTNE
jgi:hypothetical protein